MKKVDKTRVVLLVSSMIVYAVAFAGIYFSAGKGMGMSAIVPILAVGWAFGALAGGLAGFLTIPLNYCMYSIFGIDFWGESFFKEAGFSGTLALTITGVIVGRMSSLSRQLKASEEKLKDSKQFLEDVFQTSGDGIFVTDDQGYIISANKAFINLSGWTLPELLGKHVTEQSPENLTLDKLHPAIENLYEKGYIENYETILCRKDGSTYHAEQNLTAMKNEQGEVVGAVCSTRDITDRKFWDDELKKTKEQLENVIESSLDSVVISDAHGHITKMNPAFLKLLGYEESELLGKTPAAFAFYDEGTYETTSGAQVTITAEYFETGRKIMEKFFEEGKVTNWEYLMMRFDGKLVPVEENVVFVKDSRGEITGSIAVIRDITERRRSDSERKRFEEQLKRAEKMEAVGTLAGGVAHDLNNILSGIISYPELLLMKLTEDSTLRKPIETIKKSGERAAAIVNDLLTLARRGVETSELMNLNDIVSAYLNSPEYKKFIGFHPGIEIMTQLEPDLLNLEGSQVHLMKVVMNLVHNAAEAMPEGGLINVSTHNQYIEKQEFGLESLGRGDYVALSISDTGVGIPEEDLDKIFEPFYTKKKMGRSGTGLGMAVVWGTVKDHRGHIEVQSKEGEGTTFVLYFPATRKTLETTEPVLALKAYQGNGEKILVVDDVDVQREIATNVLTELGYQADSVPSGEAAIEYLRGNSVDLLVLDMIMDPGMDGCATYEKILQEHPGQRAILASGFSETDRVRKAQKLGAREYVRKPYTAASIGRAVKAELDRV